MASEYGRESVNVGSMITMSLSLALESVTIRLFIIRKQQKINQLWLNEYYEAFSIIGVIMSQFGCLSSENSRKSINFGLINIMRLLLAWWTYTVRIFRFCAFFLPSIYLTHVERQYSNWNNVKLTFVNNIRNKWSSIFIYFKYVKNM